MPQLACWSVPVLLFCGVALSCTQSKQSLFNSNRDRALVSDVACPMTMCLTYLSLPCPFFSVDLLKNIKFCIFMFGESCARAGHSSTLVFLLGSCQFFCTCVISVVHTSSPFALLPYETPAPTPYDTCLFSRVSVPQRGAEKHPPPSTPASYGRLAPCGTPKQPQRNIPVQQQQHTTTEKRRACLSFCPLRSVNQPFLPLYRQNKLNLPSLSFPRSVFPPHPIPISRPTCRWGKQRTHPTTHFSPF